MINFKTNPFKAVSFNRKAIEKALSQAHYLVADIKYDGVRGNIVVDNTGDCNWLSRVSKPIPALEHLGGVDERWLRMLKDDRCIFPQGFMLDGELMVNGVDFNKSSGILRTKWLTEDTKNLHAGGGYIYEKATRFNLRPGSLSVVLYGCLDYFTAESETEGEPEFLMREHLKAILPLLKKYYPEINWSLSESYEVYDMIALEELYQEKRKEGAEGLVVKDPLCVYKRGKKTGWWKMKPENEEDGIIITPNFGTTGLANEGKVIGFEVLLESGRTVAANNIKQEDMDRYTALWADGETFKDWQCTVRYMEKTPDGSLRHPSFYCMRGVEGDEGVKI